MACGEGSDRIFLIFGSFHQGKEQKKAGKDFVILGYQLDKESKGMIEIRDMSGKSVQSIPFSGMQDQVTVMTTS